MKKGINLNPKKSGEYILCSPQDLGPDFKKLFLETDFRIFILYVFCLALLYLACFVFVFVFVLPSIYIEFSLSEIKAFIYHFIFLTFTKMTGNP